MMMKTISEKKQFVRSVLACDTKAVKKYLNNKVNFWKVQDGKIFRHTGSGWLHTSDEDFHRMKTDRDTLVAYDNETIPFFSGQVIKKPSPQTMVAWWKTCNITESEIQSKLAELGSLDILCDNLITINN